MIGIITVTHGNIGQEMVAATRRILPEAKNIVSIGVANTDTPESISRAVHDAIRKFEAVEGIILFTDIFGGTPSNACLPFLEQPQVEMVAGVNLPMLIKVASMEQHASFVELVRFIQSYGKRNIVIARKVLGGQIESSS